MTATAADSYDVVVVGAGAAGLATALGLAGLRRVALVTSGPLSGGSTAWAQGGLAAALDRFDSASLHALDTMTAGSDFGDADAIRILADAAPAGVAQLLRAGAHLDRQPSGELALTREGGHSRRRVVHAGGDATGAETSRVLSAAVRRSDVDVLEATAVTDLLTVDRQVTGVVLRGADGRRHQVRARAVVLATGGVGGLFARTTNPAEVSGAGLGLALRAGASLVDLEFVQFHPTALDIGASVGQVPLLTEALRGEGAVLRDERGRAIMAGRHPLADLAPRDVVARRVDEVRAGGGSVFLDATMVDAVAERFPTVAAACLARGIDPAVDAIPVVPTQHFLCGGVRTDSWGATDIAGLYAVGEVAATGVHGANRLASNSLVEGLVFGTRVAARLALALPPAARRPGEGAAPAPAVATASLPRIRQLLSDAAGIRRTGRALERAKDRLSTMRAAKPPRSSVGDQWLAALALVTAATERKESRGCHWRVDHPAGNEWWRQRHVVVRLGEDGTPVATVERAGHDRTELEQSA
jgi:L-aspartate oxidase